VDVALALVAEQAQHAGEGIGHVDRAEQAELALHEHVGEGVLDDVRRRSIEAEHRAVRHRGQREPAEADPLHRAVRRMVHHLVHPRAALVVLDQPGRVALRLARQPVQLAARDRARLAQQRLGAGEMLGRQAQPQCGREVRIGIVEVQTGRVRHRAVGGKLGGRIDHVPLP
jgi:hypothetical protein